MLVKNGVTLSAIIKRINRKLKPDWKQLKVTRGWRARNDLGDYYIIDVYRNMIINCHVDPVTVAHELDVVGLEETVISDAA